ncbi:hypothetical protein QBC47DRAFT_430978 [Echria macrotheca]|uniref:Glucose-methanol-choline oxidoreductase N-terminal domain-containing protein n=1 Tax=Echria macrotheca TaxID=438768 RepID=A0AAJ0B8U4_9PEZI|nr:hypothetical protein QBC47DRAFT_430978 [Echria macrotheca]
MGLFTDLPGGINPDVIVAGGGTAGCIVAARLAQADPSLTILVIEGGRDNKNQPTIETAALFIANLLPETKTNIFYQGKASSHIGGRAPVVPSGGILGGGSSTNLMMYTRPQRCDLDSWNVPGWSADDLLPYFKKLETYHGPDPASRHGDTGPINVSDGTFRSQRSEDAFVAAAQRVGIPEVPDLQALDGSNNGVQRAKRYIGPDGKRQDTASRYLRPLLEGGKHPNLHVLVEHQVVRVLFEGTRAVGIEYRPNSLFRSSGPSKAITARRMVILSSGALGTPLILERSGIGNPDLLSRASIPMITPLPGVGESYQDHTLMVYPYRSSLSPSETLDPLADGRIPPADLASTNPGMAGWNAQDVTCKLRPPSSQIATLGPAMAAAWATDFEPIKDKPLMLMSLVGAYPGDPSSLPSVPERKQYFSISTFAAYPYSRGHVHITPDSEDIDFDPAFFSDARDVGMHMWAYKTQREIARRMECYRGEYAPDHPPFPGHSRAACGERDGPVGESEGRIEYSEEDDGILETWLRMNVGTTWHSLGTCAMRPREEAGVVDANLSVYGVEGLKIADLSVVPGNVAANTASTAMLVGEKAADLFAMELRGQV